MRRLLVAVFFLFAGRAWAADTQLEICRELVTRLAKNIDYGAVRDLKALAPALRAAGIPDVDSYHVKFWSNPISHDRYGIGHYQVGTKAKLTDVAILYDAQGKPTLIRTRKVFEDTGGQTVIGDSTAKYYRIGENNTVTELKSSVRIIEGTFHEAGSPFSPVYVPPSEEGPGANFGGSGGNVLAAKDLAADPNAVSVAMNSFALVIRQGTETSADVEKMAYHSVYSVGYGPCTGFMIEGKNFALVSHLVNAYETPPEQVIPLLLAHIKKAGLSTADLKFRIIGGMTEHKKLPVGLVEAAKRLGLEVVEQDILGRETRSFGYRLGRFGESPSAFRIR